MKKKKLTLKNILSGNPLKIVCVAGLALALIISWVLVAFNLSRGRETSVRERPQSPNFAKELRAYDFYDAPKRALEGEDKAQIERRLSRLQKQARGVEELLSVLKRWRALAMTDRRYTGGFEKAAREALKTHAYSSPLAAVAAEAVIFGGVPVSEEGRALLKSYAARISQNRFDSLDLSIYILAGSLEDPSAAMGIPVLETLLSQDLAAIPAQEHRNLLVDEVLLRAAKGDVPGAALRLNTLLGESNEAGVLRMGAEFFYDHHNPLRAGELFSKLPGEADMIRAADALVLAGEISGARNIWLALASPEYSQRARQPLTQVQSRSRYNLAAVSPAPQEEKSWLETLLAQRSQRDQDDSIRIFSTIRYTRLLETPLAAAILDEADMKQHPLLDLEHLRRRLETLPPTRAAAEVWLLIGRNSEDEALYEWAAWYFDHQKLYDETSRLLIEAGRKGMTGPWLKLHRGLALLREGKIAEGERILAEEMTSQDVSRSRDWKIPANIGRVHENRRAISLALESYQTAAALVRENRSAALIQVRISRCLEAQGRAAESRRALETALELDPDNLNIRRLLR